MSKRNFYEDVELLEKLIVRDTATLYSTLSVTGATVIGGTTTLVGGVLGDLFTTGKAAIGDAIHADYAFYVDENAVNGKLALFKTFFSGEAVVDIDSRINYDTKIRFLESGVVKWQIGNDESSSVFSIKRSTGAFDAFDVLRLSGSSTQTLQTGNTMVFYLKATVGNSSMYMRGGPNSDAQILFGADSTSYFAIGHDFSESVLKIKAGTSVSGAAAIEVDVNDNVTIPNLAGTAVRSVYADANGKLSDVVAPARELKMVGFEINDTTASSQSHDMLLIPVGAYVEKIEVWVTVPMDDPALARLNIGYFADNDHYGVWDIRTATGLITPSPYNLPERFTVERQMALFLEETSGASNGEVYIYVWYSEPSTEELLT